MERGLEMPVKINGATSGSTTITAPATGSDETIELSTALAAKADYAPTQNSQTGTGASAYTFVLADATRVTLANAASAATYTVPPQASVAWASNAIIRVTNLGAGTITFAGGSGVTVTNTAKTLAQYESANLVRTGSNAWTVVPFGSSGLAGAGGWATISAMTGSPTRFAYTDANGIPWYAFRWYDSNINNAVSGSVTVSAGVMDVLLVSCGGYCNGANDTGNGGPVLAGIMPFTAGSKTISNAGAVAGGTCGPRSICGPYASMPCPDATNSANAVGAGGTGAGSFTGVTSSITGTAVEYGPANSNTAIGGGGRSGINEYGRNGGVIVRVPQAFVTATSGWV